MTKYFERAVKATKYPYWRKIAQGISRGGFPIFLDYPVTTEIRHGWGKPPYPFIQALFDGSLDLFDKRLEEIECQRVALHAIPRHEQVNGGAYWHNPWFSGLDAASLYTVLATTNPNRYIEVGSGHSTKFAHRAINDNGLQTTITCIDPAPRISVDSVADEIIREPLEKVCLKNLGPIHRNDILFIDSSHRTFMGSDVTVAALELLPNLPSGCLIHFHDIHLPYDYPAHLASEYWSEQYLLAAMLMGGNNFEVVLPVRYVVEHPAFESRVSALFDHKSRPIMWTRGEWKRGASLWLRKR